MSSIIASGLSRWVVEGIAGPELDNVENAPAVEEPLYVSMSINDDFIPFQQAEEVYDAAVNVRCWERACRIVWLHTSCSS